MKKQIAKLLFITIVLFITSCSKETVDPDPTEPLEATTFLDQEYGSEENQDYDIHLPEDRTKETPVVIIVHGGSWVQGDKSDMAVLVAITKSKLPDYAIVNVNYRLVTETSNKHPAQENDIKSLIAELDSKQEDYQISNNYFFIGVSAGAHLSLLHSYKNDENHKVKAVCSVVGPTDFLDPVYIAAYSTGQGELSAMFLGDTYQNNPLLYEQVSPITHVNAQDTPTILFYGGKDELVPASQATRLKAKLEGAGVPVEYTLYPDASHNLQGVDFNDLVSKIVIFFEKHR